MQNKPLFEFNIRKYGKHYDLECFNNKQHTVKVVCSGRYNQVVSQLKRLERAQDFQIPKLLYDIEEEMAAPPIPVAVPPRFTAARFV